jgi:outer membrane protein OmpA-like peptidoglycan-associated protein
MKKLLLTASVLALLAPAAYAQQPRPAGDTGAASSTMVEETSNFLVFFDFDKYDLTPEAKRVVAEAAAAYESDGMARVVVTGHTDTVGSAEYNLALSERRANSVAKELVANGVPADAIVTVGEGENDLLVPTGDGVAEPQNRRVEIAMPTKPAPVAEAAPVAAPMAAPKKWSGTIGPYYGYSIEETSDPDKSAHLGGLQGGVEYALGSHTGLGVDIAGYNTFDTAESDGWGGRATAKLPFYFTAEGFRPFIGPHVGYFGGKGVQDSIIAGPLAGFQVDMSDASFLYAQVAYDVLVERNDWDGGVVSSGFGLGFRF